MADMFENETSCVLLMARVRHDEDWDPRDDINDVEDAKCDKCKFQSSPEFVDTTDKQILFHDDVIEKTGEMFKSYNDHIKLPVDFKPLMFRELLSVGKNSKVWKESSKSFSSDIPMDEIGSGSITMKKIDDDKILILVIQRMTIHGNQEVIEVLTVVDQTFHLIRENIIERFISADSVEVVSLSKFLMPFSNVHF